MVKVTKYAQFNLRFAENELLNATKYGIKP